MNLTAAIKKLITPDLTAVKSSLTALQGTANTIDTTTTQTRNSNLINYGSAVKSVQRGYWAQSSTGPANINIAISAVTPSKCKVSVFGGIVGSSNVSTAGGVNYLISLTSTQLTVSRGSYPSGGGASEYSGGSWEVVEHY